jgi:protein involved in polysaccharide export with SLBB domain
MKQLRNLVQLVAVVLGLLSSLVLTGCGTPQFIDPPGVRGANRNIDVFRVGDMVQITFVSPGAEKVFPTHDERIREDGTIRPPDIGSVKADGKTAGELQQELQTRIDRLYKNVTVTVRAGDRYFYVDGEVTQRGPKPYLGATDVVKAIAAGGGFTEFAKKSRIQLNRANGQKEIIDYQKAIEDPAYNRPVYPGDQIYVPRRIF